MTKEKTLSQQICELCGIKPKKVEKQCHECGLIMEECGCFDCYKEVYPDFENPENFVKLLELEFQYSSFRMDTFSYPKRNGFVQDTLENILGELINFKSNEKDFIKAIRDYDGWVWGQG